MNFGMHRGGKLLEHSKRFIEKVVEIRLRNVAAIDDMQFRLTPSKGTIDAVYIIRRIQE